MPENPLCPRCGSPMVLRTARKGPNAGRQFYGCSKYPECKGTLSVSGQVSADAPAVQPVPETSADKPKAAAIVEQPLAAISVEQHVEILPEQPAPRHLVGVISDKPVTGESAAENVGPFIDINIKANEEKLRQKVGFYPKFGASPAEAEVFTMKISGLFSDESARSRVLEPFQELFQPGMDAEEKIRSIITQTALFNAVMAGAAPAVSFGADLSAAMEAHMAFMAAKYMGLEISSPRDALKYFGPVSLILDKFSWIFRVILGVIFTPLSQSLDAINPKVFAAFLTTDFIGVVFWAGFQEAKAAGKFGMPASVGTRLMDETKKLAQAQMGKAAGLLNQANIALSAGRLAEYLKG